LFIVCCVVSAIGLINILIAQLDVAVQAQSRLTESYAVQNRIHLTLEVESALSLGTRRKIWDDMQLYEPLEYEKGYLGPAGGVQCLEPALVMVHPK